MPTVSVVIPTYDRAETLPRAIDSALEQTVQDLEVVVVDDGSTDGTESVVLSYEDDRVRYVPHETNQGANVARNTGIEAARGEYVALLDSDDEWRPTKLDRQLDRLEDGDTVAAYCDFEKRLPGWTGSVQTAVADLLERGDATPTEDGPELAAEILAGIVSPAAGSTLVVETETARAVGGFDVDLDRFQDPDFVLRVLEEGPVAYVDAPLVVRHDTGSPSPGTVHSAAEAYLDKHAETVSRARERGYDVVGTYHLLLAKEYLAEGETATGVRLLRRASLPVRHVPGVCWATATGLRRRTSLPTRVVPFVLAVLVVAVAVRRRLRLADR